MAGVGERAFNLIRQIWLGGEDMPRGDGTGPGGMGAGGGSGQGQGGRKAGRMGGDCAAGPAGGCVCPQCGHKEPHKRGIPCVDRKRPDCGSAMTRE